MNRLRDEAGEGPVSEKGLEIIRRTPGAPAMPEMKRRVWGALQASGLERGSAPRRFGVRAFAAAAVVLGLCGTAGAVIARRWIQPRLAPPAPVRLVPPTVAAPRTLARAAAPVAVREAPPPLPAPVVRMRPIRATAPRAADLREAATAAERTQVLDAMIALRRDHDAGRAGRLLDQYLASHPRGALREEALVLAIEAASARGDAPAARRWAATYGDAYPNGRFRKFARATLDADAP